MKFSFIKILFLLFCVSLSAQQFESFNRYFSDSTMRIDYFHFGSAENESFSIDKILIQGIWAGSRTNLIDEFNNGSYYIKIYDTESNKLIFSKGFDCYFKEYQSSEKGIQGITKTYHESALIPAPKVKIKFSIEKRDSINNLNEIFNCSIDPEDNSIVNEKVNNQNIKVIRQFYNEDPHYHLDIVTLDKG